MRPRLPQVALATLLSIWLVMAPHRALPQASQSLTTASVVQVGKFAPSNARTEDGKLIPAEQFIPATRCVKCHQDTHAAWSESLHRNAAREPFYKASVDILHNTKGPKPTQHCDPVILRWRCSPAICSAAVTLHRQWKTKARARRSPAIGYQIRTESDEEDAPKRSVHGSLSGQ